MNWQAKADKATAALRKYGAEVSLVRLTQATPTNAWDPPAQTEASYQGKGLLLSYAAHMVDGTTIQAGDVKLMLAADIATTPVAGDFVDVKTERYRVMRSEPFQPGGEVLYYDLQLRR
jgi:hypothetical protein